MKWNLVKITISKENYLKTIAEAEADGESVISSTLVRWLNVSPPAVTMAIRRLRRDGLIKVGKKGDIKLTEEGRGIADRLRQRHQLIERMLTDIFGMEWYKVHDEAEQIEHAVSTDFEQKLLEKLGPGEHCPHGNLLRNDSPEERRKRGWRLLVELDPNRSGKVVSVFERDRKLLEYLDAIGIRPGTDVAMVCQNYDETFTLRIQEKEVLLGRSAAERVWVKNHESAQ